MTTLDLPLAPAAVLPSTATLYHGDCLDVMPTLAPGSVNMCFADLPYGVVRCNWDIQIDQKRFWGNLHPLFSDNGSMVATSDVRLASVLISNSCLPFKYDLVWHKSRASGFLNANKMPLRSHEMILYFSRKGAPYTAQKKKSWRERSASSFARKNKTDCYGKAEKVIAYTYGPERFPTSVIEPDSPAKERGLHPTQKPIALLEWLIATYTNPGDTVLDPVFGSGTTGVACARLGRNFIGIEKDAAYFAAASKRIADERAALGLL